MCVHGCAAAAISLQVLESAHSAYYKNFKLLCLSKRLCPHGPSIYKVAFDLKFPEIPPSIHKTWTFSPKYVLKYACGLRTWHFFCFEKIYIVWKLLVNIGIFWCSYNSANIYFQVKIWSKKSFLRGFKKLTKTLTKNFSLV